MPSMLSTSWLRSASKIAGPSTSAPGATALSGMLRIRMPIPESHENFRSSIRSAPEASSTASLMSKLSVRRTANWPGVLPPIRNAIRLPFASRPRSARAGKPLAEIVTQNLVGAFEADIHVRTIERDRLRVVPAACGDRPAVGAEQRGGLDIGKPGHLAAPIDDTAGEPAAVVADRNETLALGVEPQPRQPAKAAKARGQHQPAAIFQRPEPDTRVIARVEKGNRPGVDLDRDGLGDRELVRDQRLWRRLRGDLRPRDLRYRGRQKPRRRGFQEAAAADVARRHVRRRSGFRQLTPHGKKMVVIPGRALARARNPYSRSWLWIPGSLVSLAPRNDDFYFYECNLRRLVLAGTTPWVSLNSSASFSVMAPPSS